MSLLLAGTLLCLTVKIPKGALFDAFLGLLYPTEVCRSKSISTIPKAEIVKDVHAVLIIYSRIVA